MNLRERLLSIRTRGKKDRQTIEDAVSFIDKVTAYAAKQRAVFEVLGYVPMGEQSREEKHCEWCTASDGKVDPVFAVVTDDYGEPITDVKYCPFCGRSLEENGR